MTSQMFIPIHRKILFVLTCIVITAGCAGFEGQSKPAAVPEIHPGILAGYLQPEVLPNSLAVMVLLGFGLIGLARFGRKFQIK